MKAVIIDKGIIPTSRKATIASELLVGEVGIGYMSDDMYLNIDGYIVRLGKQCSVYSIEANKTTEIIPNEIYEVEKVVLRRKTLS